MAAAAGFLTANRVDKGFHFVIVFAKIGFHTGAYIHSVGMCPIYGFLYIFRGKASGEKKGSADSRRYQRPVKGPAIAKATVQQEIVAGIVKALLISFPVFMTKALIMGLWHRLFSLRA